MALIPTSDTAPSREGARCLAFWCVLILILGTAFWLGQGVAFAAPNQTPGTPPGPSVTPSSPIPDGTIAKAGAALRDVAKLQQKYQSQLEAASQVQKQDLMHQISMEALQAIRSHDLSVQEYASVARSAQTDAQVKQRLLDAANRE